MSIKSATVFVVDVSCDMRGDAVRTARDVLLGILIQKAKVARANDLVAVFHVGSNTCNFVEKEKADEYPSVNQIFPVQYGMENVTVDLISTLLTLPTTPEAPSCDVSDGLVWGIEAVIRVCKHYKFDKRVVLLTTANCLGKTDFEIFNESVSVARTNEIKIDTILCDDSVDSIVKMDHSTLQTYEMAKLALLETAAENTGGTVLNSKQASRLGSRFMAVTKQPSRTLYRVILGLGDPLDKESFIEFPVCMNIKTRCMRAPKHTVVDLMEPKSTVTRVLNYSLRDTTTEVSEEDCMRAFRYGNTLVPIENWEREIELHALHEPQSFSILVFVPANSLLLEHYMSPAYVLTPDTRYIGACERFSSLLAGLHANNLVAIAKYVTRSGVMPRVVALVPYAMPGRDTEGLVMINVPYGEDVRHYESAPLNFTQSDHKVHPAFVPSKSQLDALEAYVDALSVTQDEFEKVNATSDSKECTQSVLETAFKVDNPESRRVFRISLTKLLCPSSKVEPIVPKSEAEETAEEQEAWDRVARDTKRYLSEKIYGKCVENTKESSLPLACKPEELAKSEVPTEMGPKGFASAGIFDAKLDELYFACPDYQVLPWDADAKRATAVEGSLRALESAFADAIRAGFTKPLTVSSRRTAGSVKRAEHDRVDLGDLDFDVKRVRSE